MLSIWTITPTLEGINATGAGTAVETMGIRFIEIGDDYLKAEMPVDQRTIQPAGILHGGASVVLAETLGSTAAYLTVDQSTSQPVGLDINANHIRAVPNGGKVVGTCRPIHLGRTTQVWEIQLHDEQGRLTCVSRLTMAIKTR